MIFLKSKLKEVVVCISYLTQKLPAIKEEKHPPTGVRQSKEKKRVEVKSKIVWEEIFAQVFEPNLDTII